MAVLNKIRERSVFLIVIIALALFSFVLADVIRNGGFSSRKSQSVIATINGEDIDRQEFALQVENFQQNMRRDMTTMQAVKQVWDAKTRSVLLSQQFEELGIRVGAAQINEVLEQQLAGNPNFSDENGFFDRGVLREYVANLKATSPQAYNQWIDYENSVAESAKAKIYFNLIRAGIGATLIEGKQAYHLENDNIDIQYVQIPYTSVQEVEVSDAEIEAYVQAHPVEFETEASRDLQYVLFEEKPSAEDEEAVKQEIVSLMENSVEYNSVTGTNDTIAGFKTTQNMEEFLSRNSDRKFQDIFFFKDELPEEISEEIFNLNEGEIYGPYKNNSSWNVTKVMEIEQIADSAKANHILISYEGLSTGVGLTRTKAEAKTLADSLLNVLEADAEKFAEIAAEYSADNSNKDKAGDLGWFSYGRMVPEFNTFVFNHEAGDMGIVETDFGFHIVAVKELTDEQKAMKLATLSRVIRPSEKTRNDLFTEATTFEINAGEKNFNEAAKAGNYTAKPVKGISALDENLPGIGPKREIVQWAFEEGTDVGSIRRFNVNGGYAVVQLTAKQSEGLMSAEEASATVAPILKKEKKAAIIKEKITASTLSEIATNQGVSVQSASAVNLDNPMIPGAGSEPKVIGTAFSTKVGETSQPIAGEKGVFVVKVTQRNEAPDLASYATVADQETQERTSKITGANGTGRVVEALKKKAEIEDRRAAFY